MSTKQRLLFITTGGTIASVRTQQGLKPVLTSEELLAHLPELNELCCPDTLALCSIDSTDLGPEHWLMMAKAVQENYALYDGFIICHGTDTLAYSAAALSYLIQNADKPVILTGAQQPACAWCAHTAHSQAPCMQPRPPAPQATHPSCPTAPPWQMPAAPAE